MKSFWTEKNTALHLSTSDMTDAGGVLARDIARRNGSSSKSSGDAAKRRHQVVRCGGHLRGHYIAFPPAWWRHRGQKPVVLETVQQCCRSRTSSLRSHRVHGQLSCCPADVHDQAQ